MTGGTRPRCVACHVEPGEWQPRLMLASEQSPESWIAVVEEPRQLRCTPCRRALGRSGPASVFPAHWLAEQFRWWRGPAETTPDAQRVTMRGATVQWIRVRVEMATPARN